jgi:hypothetical protein
MGAGGDRLAAISERWPQIDGAPARTMLASALPRPVGASVSALRRYLQVG